MAIGTPGLLPLSAVFLLGGCIFDRSGVEVARPRDAAQREGGDRSATERGASDAVVERADRPAVDLHPPTDLRTEKRTDLRLADTRPPDTRPPDTRPPDTRPPDTQPWPCGGLCGPIGCNTAAVPNRCYRIRPSNLNFDPATSFATPFASVQDVSLPSGETTFNAESGEVKVTGGATLRSAGNQDQTKTGIFWRSFDPGSGNPRRGVFVVKSLTVPAGAKLKVTNNGNNYLAILFAFESVTVAGTVEAVASGGTRGPGGFGGGDRGNDASTCFGGEGRGGNHTHSCDGSNTCKAGGGGGGRKMAGGDGADSASGASGGNGGSANGNDTLVPLYGGCGGGGGDDGSGSCGGLGGGGGGAVQISAGIITVSGLINVAGAGGGGSGTAKTGDNYYCAGGGGGSGGAILLEAGAASVSGQLAANGGGGGGAGDGGQNGGDGSAGTAGGAAGTAGATGSAGGAGGGFLTEGGATAVRGSAKHGGGGGGAAGRIRINATTINVPAGKASPTASTSPTFTKW